MAKLVINDGTVANDGTGDSLRTAAYKINQNFTELYAFDVSLAEVSQSGDYNDLINKPTIATTIRDLADPFLDLEQVRGTMTSSIVTDGGLYSIGEIDQSLGSIFARELNAGTGQELSLIGDNGVSINSGTANTFIAANVLGITTTNQITISAQQVSIVGAVNANIVGNVNADDGTLMIDSDTAEVVGPINNTSSAEFTGTVNFTGATITGLPVVNFSDLSSVPTTLAGYGITDGLTASDIGPLADPAVTTFEDIPGAPTLQNFRNAIDVSAGSDPALTYDPGSGEFTLTLPSIPTTVAELSDAGDYALAGDIANDYISLATLKAEVAASVDFADFQTRIAAL